MSGEIPPSSCLLNVMVARGDEPILPVSPIKDSHRRAYWVSNRRKERLLFEHSTVQQSGKLISNVIKVRMHATAGLNGALRQLLPQ